MFFSEGLVQGGLEQQCVLEFSNLKKKKKLHVHFKVGLENFTLEWDGIFFFYYRIENVQEKM